MAAPRKGAELKGSLCHRLDICLSLSEVERFRNIPCQLQDHQLELQPTWLRGIAVMSGGCLACS